MFSHVEGAFPVYPVGPNRITGLAEGMMRPEPTGWQAWMFPCAKQPTFSFVLGVGAAASQFPINARHTNLRRINLDHERSIASTLLQAICRVHITLQMHWRVPYHSVFRPS